MSKHWNWCRSKVFLINIMLINVKRVCNSWAHRAYADANSILSFHYALQWCELCTGQSFKELARKWRACPKECPASVSTEDKFFRSIPAATGKQKHRVPTSEPRTHTGQLETTLVSCESSLSSSCLMVKDKQNLFFIRKKCSLYVYIYNLNLDFIVKIDYIFKTSTILI